MGHIALAGLFAVLAGIFIASANRYARAGNRNSTWVTLTLSAIFFIATGLLLALGLPDPAPNPQAFNRGFGPGWSCAYRTDFCFRR